MTGGVGVAVGVEVGWGVIVGDAVGVANTACSGAHELPKMLNSMAMEKINNGLFMILVRTSKIYVMDFMALSIARRLG